MDSSSATMSNKLLLLTGGQADKIEGKKLFNSHVPVHYFMPYKVHHFKVLFYLFSIACHVLFANLSFKCHQNDIFEKYNDF